MIGAISVFCSDAGTVSLHWRQPVPRAVDRVRYPVAAAGLYRLGHPPGHSEAGSHGCQRIEGVASSGNYTHRIEQTGNDEIGHLVASFNELMAELERRTLQRAESDERYRNFIEIAQSPIITFLPDGKIVIANQKAEQLFGLTKEELLGQSIYDFMADPEPLREGISDYFQAGSSSLIGTTSLQTVRNICGNLFAVEMVISVSQTDQEAMFTAILRAVKTP